MPLTIGDLMGYEEITGVLIGIWDSSTKADDYADCDVDPDFDNTCDNIMDIEVPEKWVEKLKSLKSDDYYERLRRSNEKFREQKIAFLPTDDKRYKDWKEEHKHLWEITERYEAIVDEMMDEMMGDMSNDLHWIIKDIEPDNIDDMDEALNENDE